MIESLLQKRWNRSLLRLRCVLSIKGSPMALLLSNTVILRINGIHSEEQVCLSMENYTTHLLLVQMDINRDFHIVICKMADQQRGVSRLASMAMGKNNMQNQKSYRLMCQDGKVPQYRQTKRVEATDKGRTGIMMEVFTLGDTRMAMRVKGRSMNCKQMELTHSSMISKRLRIFMIE